MKTQDVTRIIAGALSVESATETVRDTGTGDGNTQEVVYETKSGERFLITVTQVA